uniref:Pentacotripeptide-repeat region of PRORP domain-containing protein n=1 Tax=Fagus sylvatica TaxID=28930 RepID=A0A2N9GNQ1_FAGSY
MWRFSDFDIVSDEKPDGNERVLEILEQDGPGFDTKLALDKLCVRISGLLVREVLLGVLRNVNYASKMRCAKLGYKFFVWSGQQENYRHTANSYHLIMKIFAECDEFKAMWRLVDEMIENGFPTTARTFNILICTCGGAGLARKVVERFIKSKTFNFRPFKHSYNAILHSLLTVNQYKLIEWVYQQMLVEGHSPDILTYNVVMCAKCIGDKPLAALNLLNHMKEVGYIVAGELEKAQEMFDEMIIKGQLPNVFTYNSMIRGFCMAGKFEEARSMLKEMESRGCNPNFLVYSTLVSNLRNAGKLSEAHEVIRHMVEKGQYVHLLSKIKKYRRC